ncbi:hypothetical protein WA026_006005 [Henosepilachna vigintioctopunctata]|uniref:Elongation of very long chain fatty acids protein n=1 Tax=Henosepilachna vigintioctopunctata TaxID=420089 RepID=A0AAW1TUJ5_9CUCU
MIFAKIDEILDKYGDDRIHEFSLCDSVWKPLSIVALYVLFVKKIGPWFMKDRQPYNVRNFVIVFDIIQIVANFYLTYKISTNYFTSDDWYCCDVDYSNHGIGRTQFLIFYWYHLLKISDILDTIFFILKKNNRQISHLHIYHHSLMIIFSWMGLKFVAGGQSLSILFANTFVHGVMYSYYLLTAIDVRYKENKAIKKLVTQIQIGQFVLLLTMGVFYVIQPCKFPRTLIIFGMVNTSYLLYLFSKFYYYEYIKTKKT